jgi:DNA polymerase-1
MNNIVIRGMATLPYLSHQEKFTSGVYGMLSQMAKYITLHSPSFVFMCNDHPPYFRKDLYPRYKYKGDGEPDEKIKQMIIRLNESRPYCNDVLRRLCIPVLDEEGFEADDMIAGVVKKYHRVFDKIVIISNDSDLYQLLVYENVLMNKGKKGGIYTHKQLKREFGITPKQWIEVLSIAGSHNAVPSISYKERLGPKTAIKIIKNSAEYSVVFQKYREEILLRARLATLPFETVDIPDLRQFKKVRKGKYKNFAVYLRRSYGIMENETFAKAFRRFFQ